MLFVKINKFGEIEQYLDVAESNINDIVIAPNPMRDNGRLITQSNIADEYTLVISTLSGAIAKQYKLSSLNPKFSTSSLSSGIYVYKLTGNNSKQTLAGKLVIY